MQHVRVSFRKIFKHGKAFIFKTDDRHFTLISQQIVLSLKMNDGMRSSGLVCISTNTFSDVDIFLFTKCLRFAPQTGELLQNSYFFAKNNIFYKKEYITIHRLL